MGTKHDTKRPTKPREHFGPGHKAIVEINTIALSLHLTYGKYVDKLQREETSNLGGVNA